MSNDDNQAIYTALKLLGIVEVNINVSQYGSKALVHESVATESSCEVKLLYALRHDHEDKYRINTFIPPEDKKIKEIFELIAKLRFHENSPF